MILPINIKDRSKIFSSIYPQLSKEIIDYLTYNKNIYYISDSPIISLQYIIPNKKNSLCSIKEIKRIASYLHISIIIDKPFILYAVKNDIIKGVYTTNFENEILYNQYIKQIQINREKIINQIINE